MLNYNVIYSIEINKINYRIKLNTDAKFDF